MPTSKTEQLLGALASSLLAGALLVAARWPRATGYEISLYAAYPSYFWGLIAAVIACGVVLMVHQAFSENLSRWWVTGFAALLAAEGLVLLLPILRGYAFYGTTDPGAHAGFVKDIASSGYANRPETVREDIYPAAHILAVATSYIAGLDSNIVVMFMPLTFFISYVISIYVLGFLVSGHRSQALLIGTCGLPLLLSFFQSQFIPNILAFSLLPLVLYLFCKKDLSGTRQIALTVLFLLALLALPFFHVVDALAYIITFSALGLSARLYQVFVLGHRDLATRSMTATAERGDFPPMPAAGSSRVISPASGRRLVAFAVPSVDVRNAIAVLFVVCFIWFSAFAAFPMHLRGLRDWLIYGVGQSQAEIYAGWLRRANAPFLVAVKIFLATHGAGLLYAAVAGILSSAAWIRVIFSRAAVPPHYAAFSLLFLIWAPLVILGFLSGFQVHYRRTLPYALFAATVVCGLGLYQWWARSRRKNVVASFIVVLLSTATAMGVFSVHRSPFIRGPNEQVTAMEREGTRWFLQYQDGTSQVDQIAFLPYGVVASLVGAASTPANICWGTGPACRVADHFGYDVNAMYGQAYKKDRYFLNNKLSRIWERELIPDFPAAWRFTESDWERLETDPSVLRLYHNGEFEVYRIRAQSSGRR